MLICDTRHEPGRILRFTGLHHDVVLLCDQIQTRRSLARDLSSLYTLECADGTLDRVIEELLQSDVLLSEDDHLLALPIGQRFRTTEELRSYVLDSSLAERVEDE